MNVGWRSKIEHVITRAWYEGALWLWLFLPLSLLFGWLSAQRRRHYRNHPPEPLPVAVAVVGGITVGGTGKTPVIIALIKALTAQGLRLGVVSRGYGGADGTAPSMVSDRSTAAMVGDEPLLVALATGVPVAVGTDRAAAVRLLAQSHELDLVLSDDGLQHYAMPREFEIVVLDAQRGLGNQKLLPMGPLREGSWRLEQANWILERNGTEPDSGFRYQVMAFRHWRSRSVLHPSVVHKQWLSGTVAAVTALGQPDQFFNELEQLGLEISRHAYPDHYALTKADLDAIWGDVIVITAKDAVKLDAFDDERIWVLEIEAVLPAALVDALATQFGTATDVGCPDLDSRSDQPSEGDEADADNNQ